MFNDFMIDIKIIFIYWDFKSVPIQFTAFNPWWNHNNPGHIWAIGNPLYTIWIDIIQISEHQVMTVTYSQITDTRNSSTRIIHQLYKACFTHWLNDEWRPWTTEKATSTCVTFLSSTNLQIGFTIMKPVVVYRQPMKLCECQETNTTHATNNGSNGIVL